MRDLAGRRVNVGPIGSGTRITAMRILAAHGLDQGRLGEPADLALGPALAALRDGRIDAVIQVIGAPSDDIRTAFTTLPLRLVPLESSAIEDLARQPAYIAATIPKGTYPTLAESVPTIGVAAMLVATNQLTTGEVARIVQLVFTASDLVAAGSVQGAQVGARTARLGLTIPLHEGAEPALAAIGAR
jgi:TRAP transporter TAXI family solute receptor